MQLFNETAKARGHVYRVGHPTPIVRISVSELDSIGTEVYLKMESSGPSNSYKWRGAFNAAAAYIERSSTTANKTLVAASAGNHAQGIAIAASKLGVNAKIFMPTSAPETKRNAVLRYGGKWVEIISVGDTYNEAATAAVTYTNDNKSIFIHPFDDLYTMAGQGTLADEIFTSDQGPFEHVFLQIGGGGMAAGVANYLKAVTPNVHITGVEGVDQACMFHSIQNNSPITLDTVDKFCDGTAVTRPGDLTFKVCQNRIDDYMLVTNDEVSAAIELIHATTRTVPEASGAMGLAGLLKYVLDPRHAQKMHGKKLLCVVSGANIDFKKIGLVAHRSAVGAHRRRYYRFTIPEKTGGLLELLDNYFDGLNVSDFLYGKTHASVAHPIIGLEADIKTLDTLEQKLRAGNIEFSDVSSDTDVRFNIIRYEPSMFKDPQMLEVQFPERKGALRDFMRKVAGIANLCYFNYSASGEEIGRAVMGYEFENTNKKSAFFNAISQGTPVKYTQIAVSTQQRLIGCTPTPF